MLSSFRRSNDYISRSGIEPVSFSGRGYGSKFSLPQFLTESCSLLLEDQRSSTSSKGDIKAVMGLFLNLI